MDKRYQIFISSTYKDLIEERQKVIEAILKLYHFPIGMEMFHADNEEQWCQIKNTIDMSDYYVLIVGRYCGTFIEKEGISYTEKEYNYAMQQGIPVLSFVISDEAEKKSFGVESAKQQRALKKFVKKVKQFPCLFWKTSEELAFQVATTLSIKFQENNREGWVKCNFNSIDFQERKIDDELIGNYQLIYYTEFKLDEKKKVQSCLKLMENGKAILYNNQRNDFEEAEYVYRGVCDEKTNVIYFYLKNDFSEEQVVLSLMRSVGNSNRFLGLLTGLSANMVPVAIKIAMFKENAFRGREINEKLLKQIITSSNSTWENNMLTFEEREKQLFYSDRLFAKGK